MGLRGPQPVGRRWAGEESFLDEGFIHVPHDAVLPPYRASSIDLLWQRGIRSTGGG